MLRIADRAGFTGALSPFVNAIKGVRYDRSLLESLAGPIVGQIANFGQKGVELAVRNDKDTNTAERNAAAAFYDVIVKPAANTAVVASRLPGVIKTPAVMASGSVGNGGVIPSPKEAFVDRIAGPKEE